MRWDQKHQVVSDSRASPLKGIDSVYHLGETLEALGEALEP